MSSLVDLAFFIWCVSFIVITVGAIYWIGKQIE
jgi:hypothetical protein